MSVQTPPGLDQAIASLSQRLVTTAARHARVVLAAAAAFTIGAAVYSVFGLGINSDTKAMLSSAAKSSDGDD